MGTLDRSGYWNEGDRVDEWGPAEWLKEEGLGLRYAHGFNWGAGMMLGYVPADVLPKTYAETILTIITCAPSPPCPSTRVALPPPSILLPVRPRAPPPSHPPAAEPPRPLVITACSLASSWQ